MMVIRSRLEDDLHLAWADKGILQASGSYRIFCRG